MKKLMIVISGLMLAHAPANAQSFPFPIDAGAICRDILGPDATPAEINECAQQLIKDLEELLNGGTP